MGDEDDHRFIVRSPWLGVPRARIERIRHDPPAYLHWDIGVAAVLAVLIPFWSAVPFVCWLPIILIIGAVRAHRDEQPPPGEPRQAAYSNRR